MKASELKNRQVRRLNKVLHKDVIKSIDCIAPGQVILLEDRKTEESFGGWVDLDEVEFIPLTEYWLMKFNFDIEEIHAGLNEADFGHNPITKDFILTIKNTGSGWFYRNGHFKIDFVHQLQNLYFALCGEEL